MMSQTGNSWYDKLAAQFLFPTVGPILVDLKEVELRDAFVTGFVAQYTDGVDGQLEILLIEQQVITENNVILIKKIFSMWLTIGRERVLFANFLFFP